MNETPPPKEPSKEGSAEKKDSSRAYLELGQGIARNEVAEKNPETKEEEKQQKDEAQTPPSIDQWHDKPTYDDQYSKYPQTTRTRGPHFCVYNMADEKSSAALDALMDRQYPETAPQIIPIDVTKHFCDQTGNWKILVSYYTVQYRKLLSEHNKP